MTRPPENQPLLAAIFAESFATPKTYGEAYAIFRKRAAAEASFTGVGRARNKFDKLHRKARKRGLLVEPAASGGSGGNPIWQSTRAFLGDTRLLLGRAEKVEADVPGFEEEAGREPRGGEPQIVIGVVQGRDLLAASAPRIRRPPEESEP